MHDGEAANRRLQVLSLQLGASASSSSSPSHPSNAVGAHPSVIFMSSCAASSSYASATGTPTSYARIHGEVSRAPAAWKRISTVAREELTDVFYDKAEGIAKVTE